MKKYISIFIPLLLLFSVSVAAAADYAWPPPNVEMPRTILTEDSLEKAFTSMKFSLGSISGMGLKILGVCLTFTAMTTIFGPFFLDKLRLLEGVRHNEFRRKVNALDRARNLDSIVEERVSNMEVNLLAKNRFRLRHPHADLDEKIYQRELSYQADQVMRERHPEREFDESMRRRLLSVRVREAYQDVHFLDDVANRFYQREVSRGAAAYDRLNNPDAEVEENARRREVSYQGKRLFLKRKGAGE